MHEIHAGKKSIHIIYSLYFTINVWLSLGIRCTVFCLNASIHLIIRHIEVLPDGNRASTEMKLTLQNRRTILLLHVLTNVMWDLKMIYECLLVFTRPVHKAAISKQAVYIMNIVWTLNIFVFTHSGIKSKICNTYEQYLCACHLQYYYFHFCIMYIWLLSNGITIIPKRKFSITQSRNQYPKR